MRSPHTATSSSRYSPQLGKGPCSNEDPERPKLNKFKFKSCLVGQLSLTILKICQEFWPPFLPFLELEFQSLTFRLSILQHGTHLLSVRRNSRTSNSVHMRFGIYIIFWYSHGKRVLQIWRQNIFFCDAATKALPFHFISDNWISTLSLYAWAQS